MFLTLAIISLLGSVSTTGFEVIKTENYKDLLETRQTTLKSFLTWKRQWITLTILQSHHRIA